MQTIPLRLAWAAIAVVVLVAAVLIWAVPHGRVPVPGPSADPAEVVQTYLKAVSARDFETADAIDARSDGELGLFSRPMTAENLDAIVSTAIGDKATVDIIADYGGSDGSLLDGQQFGYQLERGSDGRWLIVSAGVS